MATITIEIRKRHGQTSYPVTFLVCQGKTKKRIPTGISVTNSELASNGKKIKEPTKARLVEVKRRELQDKLNALSIELIGQDVDAAYICSRLTTVQSGIDFFTFADEWLEHTDIKGKKNYVTMLNTFERYLGQRRLPFASITYDTLKGFEEFLKEKPRAQSLYLGQMRHLYREAMRRYNTDYDQVIKNDPFLRYKVPRQVLKKGIRALSLEQLLKIYGYEGTGRAQLARDCFILSFCLMGMNGVDMYNCTKMEDGYIKYNRTKTMGRRSDGAYIEVKVLPQVAGLVERYKGKRRVFDFYERYASAANFQRALDIGLKDVGKAVGIESLTFYQARHTFATLSRNLMRFSKSDVDESLNHVGTMDIADVYIAKDFSIINRNNKKLLKKVFGGETSSAPSKKGEAEESHKN